MKVHVRGHGVTLSPALNDYCQAHLVDRITRFYDDSAAELIVTFSDTNGPRGGVDKSVSLSFFMPGARLLRAEATHEDPYRSLDAARATLVRNIKDELGRMRQNTAHGPLHEPLGRTAAAAERQVEAFDDDPDASAPKIPIDAPLPELPRG